MINITVLVILLILLMAFLLRRGIAGFVERKTASYQNSLLLTHYAEVQNIYQNMRGWRHDYHNHLQTIKGHLTLKQTEELWAYLDELEADLKTVDATLKTGNLMVDAILNSKLSLAAARDITIHAKAFVPEKIMISEIDICVILGNLLDNAIESCMYIEDKNSRFIRVYIDILKKQLYISVTNSVGIEPKKQGPAYISIKSKGGGFGLKRIDAIIKKYGGFRNRQNEPGVFATEIMLPLCLSLNNNESARNHARLDA